MDKQPQLESREGRRPTTEVGFKNLKGIHIFEQERSDMGGSVQDNEEAKNENAMAKS